MKPTYEDLQSQLTALTSQLESVVAENAGLKAAISCHAAGFTVCEACGEENISGNDDVCRALNYTPATDAFLAEVRASGVEMLLASLPPYYTARADVEKFSAQLRQEAAQ